MIIKNKRKGIIILEFCKKELIILSNSIIETIKEIEDLEFHTRVGTNAGEAKLLLEKILNALANPIKSKGNGAFWIDLSETEMLILNNALNEVTAGFHIEEFEKHIGAPKDEVRLLLNNISRAFDALVGTEAGGDSGYFGHLR
jgi:hypothetical protein